MACAMRWIRGRRFNGIAIKLVNILSRPELRPELVEGRSEGRIEGCGSAKSRRVHRTLRYALHWVPRYSGCVLSEVEGMLTALT
jgi:hypothetical protein